MGVVAMPASSMHLRLNHPLSHLKTISDPPSALPHPGRSTDIMSDIATKEWSNLPSFDELPHFHEHAGCAWGVWGSEDQLGTVNLLTPAVVKRAASEEIRFVCRFSYHIMPAKANVYLRTGPDGALH